ncbi:double zinc ribbon domain-containing protein [Rhodopila sp.]|uniref:double zinc ribbon domain-containing protein n=1 Tax=Rhodopila sp. TaxID=2480087 RepID=UPI0038D0DB03
MGGRDLGRLGLGGRPRGGRALGGGALGGRSLSLLRRAGTRTLDTLLPPQCPVCGSAVDRQGALCAGCFARINFVTPPFCERCGVPFAAHQAGACPACTDHPPVFRQARAALRYDRQSRDLILPFKHADRLELAPVLAAMMARAGAALLARAEVLVPVPLHRRRLFHRRYNQAAVLAGLLGRSVGVPALLDGLVRQHETESLDDKSPQERALAVAGAFAVRGARVERVRGRTVLLVDDVMTSGATANGCARALLDAGAAAVDVLVAARVPDPRLS